MALKPVVSEVDVFRSEVRDREVNAFAMFSDCEAEFDKFGDVPALVAGPIGVVDQDWYYSLLRVKSMFLDIRAVDGAAGATAVDECLHVQDLSSCARFNSYRECEVPGRSVDILDRFTEFVQAFSSQLSSFSEGLEELIGELPQSVLMYPNTKGSMGSVVVTCFLDRS